MIKKARPIVAVGLIASVIVMLIVLIWNFYGYTRAMTVADAAADRFYSYDVLENPGIKETLKKEKSSLQGMATRKRSAMFGDLFRYASAVLLMSVSYGAVYAFSRIEEQNSPRRKRDDQFIFGQPDEVDDDYERRVQ